MTSPLHVPESCAKFDAMSYKHSYFHFADLIILSLIEVNLSLFLFFLLS